MSSNPDTTVAARNARDGSYVLPEAGIRVFVDWSRGSGGRVLSLSEWHQAGTGLPDPAPLSPRPAPVDGPRRWEWNVGPGAVQLVAVDELVEAKRDARAELVERAERWLWGDDESSEGAALVVELTAAERLRSGEATRGRIRGWSAKSRRRMMLTLAMCERQGRWGMLTLTAPGDGADGTGWLSMFPDPASFKQAFRVLRERWAREFGRRMSGMWKLEFQHRGAPHFHVGLDYDGLDAQVVEQFCREAWHSICVHDGARCPGDSCAHRHHRVRGASFDVSVEARSSGKSFAAYFAKHGVWSSKAGQNVTPGRRMLDAGRALNVLCAGAGDELLAAGEAWECPGRWWGRLNLERRVAEGQVPEHLVEAMKLVARKVFTRRTYRTGVTVVDGVPVAYPIRRSLRSLRQASGGFWMLASDGPEYAAWLMREAQVVAGLSGRARARYLAELVEPGGKPPPARKRQPVTVRS